MLTIGTLLLDRYRIDGVLGQGGMGSVYLATHIHLNRPVAIKQLFVRTENKALDATALRQFKHEAMLLQNLRHPRLPAVYDYIEVDGSPYLMMEYVRGSTLADVLETGVRQSEATVRRWSLALCEVLEYLHTRTPPIIFRDMKPSNIMLDPHGQIKLIDFGIAKLFDSSASTKTFAKGSGSPGYSAPEQYQGTTDARSDVYSLGATMYALLAQRKPPQSVELAAGLETLPFLHEVRPDVSREFSDIVHWCLQLRAVDRPETVQAVRKAIEATGGDTLPEAQPSPGGLGFATRDAKASSRENTMPLASTTSGLTHMAGSGPADTGQLGQNRVQAGHSPLEIPNTRKAPMRPVPADVGSATIKRPALQIPPVVNPPPVRHPSAALVGGLGAVVLLGAALVYRFNLPPAVAPAVPQPTASVQSPTATASPTDSGPATLYGDVRATDEGSAYHYESARQRLMAMRDYTMEFEVLDGPGGSPVRYSYRCIRPRQVRTEVLSGPHRGLVYVYLGQGDKVMVRQAGKTTSKKLGDPGLRPLPVANSLFDSLFVEVQKTALGKPDKETVNGRDCWILPFSNGTTWDVDRELSLIARVKHGSRTETFSHIETNTHPRIGL